MAFPKHLKLKISAAQSKVLGSRRRSATLIPVEAGYEVECSGTAWDGGSINAYFRVNARSHNKSAISCSRNPQQFGGGPAPRVPVQEGILIVQCGTFQGKPGWPRVWGTREDLERALDIDIDQDTQPDW